MVDEAGASFDGASLDDIRSWVSAASAKIAESEEAAAG